MTTTLTYSNGDLQAQLVHTKKALVRSVSFSISAGESLALIGETGSGKTLIAQSIMGVLPENVHFTNGAISFCGKALPSGKKLRSMLGMDIVYIPQNGHEFLNPSRKIRQHLYDSLKKLEIPSAKRCQVACEKLFLAGFSDPEAILEQYPFQLSGGMAQRVTIALALCSQAKLLIADEATNGLDLTGKQQFMSVLCTLFPDTAKLVITHDISVAAACDRILVLCKGQMLETGAACDVLSNPRHPYTQALLGALNEHYPQKPNVEKIVYRLFGNEDTMYLALQQGDIDMVWGYSTGVAGTYQDVLAGDENISLINVAASNAPAVLAFNNANGLFADENLRQAVSYALDYDAFKTYFGSTYAEIPNRGFVPSTTVGYKDTEKLTTDTTKAEEYMNSAGYSEKNEDGFFVNANGQTAAFTLTVNASKEAHVGYAEMIKTQLEQFGIQVHLDTIDQDAYNAKTSNKFSENNVTMEAAIYGYTAAGMGMGNGLGSIYVDGNHAVQGGCQVFNEEFQSISEEMTAATVLEDYYAGAAKLQDYYAVHTPLIALYWDNMMLAYSSKLDNVTVDAVFGLNNVNNWFSIIAK